MIYFDFFLYYSFTIMNCCCPEDHGVVSYEQDLDMLLYNKPPFAPHEIPQLKIKLDLPDDSGYLATYWPGQKITGQLNIHLNQPVKINHLHIVLFGHVQVYGDFPGQPLRTGLFDHARNEKLTHTGVRVTLNQQQQLETQPVYPTNHDKSAHDRYLENLIKKVCTLDHTIQGTSHLPILYHQSQCSPSEEPFDLRDDSYSVNFSMRVPSRSVHSMDHPHFPITYRIVAFMHGRTLDQDMICYSTKKIRIESFLQPSPLHILPPSPTYQYIHQRNESWIQSMYTMLLSNSKQWMIRQQSYLSANLSAPLPVVERGEYVPLTVTIENHAVFHIGTVSMSIELVKHVRLVCSLNEEVETEILQSVNVELKNETHHNLLVLEMPRMIQVPKECVCSIEPKSTRDIVSLEYDVLVHLTCVGDTNNAGVQTATTSNEPHSVYLDHHHIVQQNEKLGGYTWKLNSLPVFIGNKKLA